MLDLMLAAALDPKWDQEIMVEVTKVRPRLYRIELAQGRNWIEGWTEIVFIKSNRRFGPVRWMVVLEPEGDIKPPAPRFKGIGNKASKAVLVAALVDAQKQYIEVQRY